MPLAACQNHATAPAVWRCSSCNNFFCDLCIRKEAIGLIQLKTCLLCKGKCEPAIAPQAQAVRSLRHSFPGELPGAFAYPFKGGALLLVIGSLFFWSLNLFVRYLFAGIIGTFAAGYLSAYLLSIIVSTSDERDRLPDWPTLTDWWMDIVRPFLLILGTVVFCLLPSVAVIVVGTRLQVEALWLQLVLLGAGLLYLPMGLVAVAIFDSVSGLNPLRVIPGIFKTFGGYLLASLVLAMLVTLRLLAGFLLDLISVPVLGSLVEGFISFYLLVVEMRILGLFYRANMKRLNWLDLS